MASQEFIVMISQYFLLKIDSFTYKISRDDDDLMGKMCVRALRYFATTPDSMICDRASRALRWTKVDMNLGISRILNFF